MGGLLDRGEVTKEEVERWTGATRTSVNEWLAGKGPALEIAVRTTIDANLAKKYDRRANAARPIPLHLQPEWQKERIFTATVQCLIKMAATKRYEAIEQVYKVLAIQVGWEESDWRRLLEEGIDYWELYQRYLEEAMEREANRKKL